MPGLQWLGDIVDSRPSEASLLGEHYQGVNRGPSTEVASLDASTGTIDEQVPSQSLLRQRR
jgi:hypothetical protein